jgi:hypothetical protein
MVARLTALVEGESEAEAFKAEHGAASKEMEMAFQARKRGER